ncbi:MAG: ribose 5-phosphate isomerase B [Acidobacteria bacterium]|nr:ribose 5-phosphate isomerase B [Acidobacteriota bacterium]
MKIAIGSDHAGFEVKEWIKEQLAGSGVEVEDVGTHSEASVDYPDFAAAVGEKVGHGQVDRGILVCGSGIGMAMAANKVSGVRAALAFNEETARLSREHNDANVLTVGARTTERSVIPEIVRTFLSTPFAGGRHERRVEKITELERTH